MLKNGIDNGTSQLWNLVFELDPSLKPTLESSEKLIVIQDNYQEL